LAGSPFFFYVSLAFLAHRSLGLVFPARDVTPPPPTTGLLMAAGLILGDFPQKPNPPHIRDLSPGYSIFFSRLPSPSGFFFPSYLPCHGGDNDLSLSLLLLSSFLPSQSFLSHSFSPFSGSFSSRFFSLKLDVVVCSGFFFSTSFKLLPP